jgi:hypothetical protein
MNKQLINEEIKKFNIDSKEINKIYDNIDIKKFNKYLPLSIFETSIVFITIYLLCYIIYKYINKKN